MRKFLIFLLAFLLTACQSSSIEETIDFAPPIYYYEMDVYQESSLEIEDYIQQALDSFVNHKDQLISSIDGKGTITWEVVSGNVEIDENNVIYKLDNALDNEVIQLKATYTDDTQTIEVLCEPNICLDEYVGYLMSYFSNTGEDKESLKLMFSYDGILWFNINAGKAILKPSIGTTALRDPSFVRRKDGGFTLIATQGWNNPEIYAFETTDFMNYENERLLSVNKTSTNLEMSEFAAWAPEGFYDYREDTYYIYWSSVEDEGIFYNTTSDFELVSLPNTLVDVGYPIIDASIVKDGAHYYIMLKDEREPMEEHSNVFVGSSSSDFLNFDKFGEPITNHQAEGPFVLFCDYRYLLYYDDYTRQQYNVRWIDFDEGFTDVISDETNLNAFEQISHGSAIAITWDELQSLLPYME